MIDYNLSKESKCISAFERSWHIYRANKKNSIGVADGILRGTFLEYATGCKCGGEDSGEQKKIGQ